MEVILLEDHVHLGQRGDVVNVANGYARNYLIPKRLAVPNTKAKRKAFEAEEQFHKRTIGKERESAIRLKEEIAGIQINIKAKVGKEGKLFGSITNKHIAEAIMSMGYEIDKRSIEFTEPIREIGTYDIEISLFQDVKTHINLLVEEESND